MKIRTLSPSAYVLRKQWEREDKKLFATFRKDEGKIQIINALAEMLTRLEMGRSSQIQVHF